jgi:hypothetical protein
MGGAAGAAEERRERRRRVVEAVIGLALIGFAAWQVVEFVAR